MPDSLSVLSAKIARKVLQEFPRSRMLLRNGLRRIFTDEEILVWTPEGFSIYASPHDYASYGIFFFREYDSSMTWFLKTHVMPGQHFWDIGTERGWFSLLASALVGSEGRVDCIEALPVNFEKLKRNLSYNGFFWAHAHNLAASDTNQSVFFEPPSNNITQKSSRDNSFLKDCGGIGYVTEEPTHSSIRVPGIRLDDFAANEQIERLDFVKMDIEGSEYKALVGGQNILSLHRPVLIIEYNQVTSKRVGTEVAELDYLLSFMNYDRYVFTNRMTKFDIHEWNSKPDDEFILNVYCFPR